MVEYNPYSYEVQDNPYPVYRRLRREAPVYRNEELGFWALSRHRDVLAAFRDTERLSNSHGVSLEPSAAHAGAHQVMSFLAMDPPRHDHMRSLISRGFTPRRVVDLEPHIRELARGYLDAFIDSGHCDFIADLAGRLPMDIISEMLGVPADDRSTLRQWADTVVHREEGMLDVPEAGMEAAARILGYFEAFVTDRHRNMGDDLVSALLRAEVEGERLTESDVVAFLFLMIIAGNETTTKLLGNAMYWLWKNPSERDRVRKDPGLIPRWVEETLRFDPSSQTVVRTLKTDMRIDGHELAKGDKLALLIGSANHDEQVFADPERFDIMRDTTDLLSFGHGTHFCVGASLARLEGRVTLEEVHKRMADFEIDESGIERVHSINVRGFAALPMGF